MNILIALWDIVLAALAVVIILGCIFFGIFIVLAAKEYIKMVEEDEKKDG